MPEIARFYGIIIRMFFFMHEHNPPHFHASYGDYAGVFSIKTMEMIEGNMPKEARRLIKKWGKKYQKDLLAMWEDQSFRRLPWQE